MTNLILSILLILCLAWPSHALSPAISQGTQAKSGTPAGGMVGHASMPAVGAGQWSISANYLAAVATSSDFTGTLGNAYIYYDNNNAAACKVCVYTRAGSSPAVGDTLVGCSDGISTGSSSGWKTATTTGNVTSAANYWIVVIVSGSHAWDNTRVGTGTAGSFLLDGGADPYSSPPANLAGSWSGDWEKSPISAYVTN